MNITELIDLKARIWKIEDEQVQETLLVIMEEGELTFFQQIDPRASSELWAFLNEMEEAK